MYLRESHYVPTINDISRFGGCSGLLVVLCPELLNELTHLRVPVVQQPLHLVGDLVRINRVVDVIVATVLVIDLLAADEPDISKSLDGAVGGRPLAG